MKRLIKKTQGLIKGAPTAVLVSAVLHLILFAVFGGIVVFSVVQKMEKKFTPPPPVERPKMELKKPKVKIKKKPRPKAMQRIVSKQVQAMPDLQLPAVSGAGEGLGGGIGGFELMPDPADMSLFGSKKSVSIGNDFEGTFYALGLDRRGRRNSISGLNYNAYYGTLTRFYESGWNPRVFAMFYRAPQKLYATFFYVPLSFAAEVPRSFGIPDEVYSYVWLAHYKGKIASKTGGKFRLWGRGDESLAVRVGGKEVLQGGHLKKAGISSSWRSSSKQHRTYWRGQGPIGVGDWFELEPGVPVEMEVIFGDVDGCGTSASLTVEEYGVSYPRRNENDGAPILPVFKTADIPQHLIDEIDYLTTEGDVDLTHDLMFNVY